MLSVSVCALLVCTSRFWHNYRHHSSILAAYSTLRSAGLSDENIVLMVADEGVPADPRNPLPGHLWSESLSMNEVDGSRFPASHPPASPHLPSGAEAVYDSSVRVDYSGYEVNVRNFLRILEDDWDLVSASSFRSSGSRWGVPGRGFPPPRNRRLCPAGDGNGTLPLPGHRPNLLIMMAGHGGFDFLKFQDAEELHSSALADSVAAAKSSRFANVLVIVDTCHGASILSGLEGLNGVLAVAASTPHGNSYSAPAIPFFGQALSDGFSLSLLRGVVASVCDPLPVTLNHRHPSNSLTAAVLSRSAVLSNAPERVGDVYSRRRCCGKRWLESTETLHSLFGGYLRLSDANDLDRTDRRLRGAHPVVVGDRALLALRVAAFFSDCRVPAARTPGTPVQDHHHHRHRRSTSVAASFFVCMLGKLLDVVVSVASSALPMASHLFAPPSNDGIVPEYAVSS